MTRWRSVDALLLAFVVAASAVVVLDSSARACNFGCAMLTTYMSGSCGDSTPSSAFIAWSSLPEGVMPKMGFDGSIDVLRKNCVDCYPFCPNHGGDLTGASGDCSEDPGVTVEGRPICIEESCEPPLLP